MTSIKNFSLAAIATCLSFAACEFSSPMDASAPETASPPTLAVVVPDSAQSADGADTAGTLDSAAGVWGLETAVSSVIEAGAVVPGDVTTLVHPAQLVIPEVDAKLSGSGPLLWRNDMESEMSGCWDNRNSKGYGKQACGQWGSIGTKAARLVQGEASHSGSKALAVTFGKNEEVGGASLSLSADIVHVRAYYNFAQGFDFGQGIKVGRVSSFNEATQVNDIDIILEVRSAAGKNQCGLTDMADIGLFFNGKPAGHDWGHAAAALRFERGRWYAVEYQIKLNKPGAKDGEVKLWIDGTLAANRAGLNIRGKAGASTKLNRIRMGGWYSNSARGNKCANPSQPSTVYIDDVAVGTDRIGLN